MDWWIDGFMDWWIHSGGFNVRCQWSVASCWLSVADSSRFRVRVQGFRVQRSRFRVVRFGGEEINELLASVMERSRRFRVRGQRRCGREKQVTIFNVRGRSRRDAAGTRRRGRLRYSRDGLRQKGGRPVIEVNEVVAVVMVDTVLLKEFEAFVPESFEAEIQHAAAQVLRNIGEKVLGMLWCLSCSFHIFGPKCTKGGRTKTVLPSKQPKIIFLRIYWENEGLGSGSRAKLHREEVVLRDLFQGDLRVIICL